MKKLVKGIVHFRQTLRPEYQETFARLALGQRPDTLFLACSDSRVVPNLFASSDPGDLFVVRNVGNLIAPCGEDGRSVADESEAAAIEFAVLELGVTDVIVCGHSGCGAMHAALGGVEKIESPNLRAWLRHAGPALERLAGGAALGAGLERHDQLSQLNVLAQLEHLKSYPPVGERVAAGRLRLHGWWFEIPTASVHAYDEQAGRFVLIDEKEAARILERMALPQ